MEWVLNRKTMEWENITTGMRVKRSKTGWSGIHKAFGTDRIWAIFRKDGSIVTTSQNAARTFKKIQSALDAADLIATS